MAGRAAAARAVLAALTSQGGDSLSAQAGAVGAKGILVLSRRIVKEEGVDVTLGAFRRRLTALMGFEEGEIDFAKRQIKELVLALMQGGDDDGEDDIEEPSPSPKPKPKVNKKRVRRVGSPTPSPVFREDENATKNTQAAVSPASRSSGGVRKAKAKKKKRLRKGSPVRSPARRAKRSRRVESSEDDSEGGDDVDEDASEDAKVEEGDEWAPDEESEEEDDDDGSEWSDEGDTRQQLSRLRQMARAARLGNAIFRDLPRAGSKAVRAYSRALKSKGGITFRGLVPSHVDIAKMKRAKDLERELDGMDPSNIIANRRGRRAASRSVRYDYDNETDDDDDDDEESEAYSSSASSAPPKPKAKSKSTGKKTKGRLKRGGDGSDSESSYAETGDDDSE